MRRLIDNVPMVTVFFLVLFAVSSALPASFSLEDSGELYTEEQKDEPSKIADGALMPSASDSERESSDNPAIYFSSSTEEVTEYIPHGSIRTPCDTLPYGEEQISVKGVDGIIVHRYETLTLENGSTIRILTESETVRAAIDEVILFGNCPSTPYNEFLYPTTGELTSGFGYRTLFGVRSFHYGIDIANDEGTPVMASDSGTVILACTDRSYGNYILIDHHNGFVTCYAHLKSFCVSEGDAVHRGEVIGAMGHTGVATGNHLHFEVRLDGERVNPVLYLSDKLNNS